MHLLSFSTINILEFTLGNIPTRTDMASEKDKRLQSSLKTATGAFDQAVAVSQDALNDGLYYLFDKYEDLQKMKVNKKKFGRIDAMMDHAEVSLPVKSSSYRTLVFYCIFQTGKLVLTDDDGYGSMQF